MAEIRRAISSRRGYRAHLTKLLQNVDECLDTPPPITADKMATLRDLHEQLQRKHDLITALDAKILEALNVDDEIEAEILQTEEIASLISTAKAKISHRLTPTVPAVVETRHASTSSATLPPSDTREPVSLT